MYVERFGKTENILQKKIKMCIFILENWIKEESDLAVSFVSPTTNSGYPIL